MGESAGEAGRDASAVAQATAQGEGERKSFGDIGEIAPDATALEGAGADAESLPEYASAFEAEPESGIARTIGAADETPSGIVLVAEAVASFESTPPEAAPYDASPDAPLDSLGGMSAARASLDGLSVLEQHPGDPYPSNPELFGASEMPPVEAASGVLDVVPQADDEVEPAPAFDFTTDLAEAVPVAVVANPYAAAPYEPAPAEHEEEERPSTPIARVSISRMMQAVVLESVPPSGSRRVHIALTVSPALLGGCDEAFVTLTLADGKVVHEGTCNAEGKLTVSVVIPGTDSELRALLDTGSKYKNARIKLADSGITEYVFR